MQQIKTSRTYQLHNALQPVPKASTRFLELSDAELAAKARRIAYLETEIARHQSKANELRREQACVIGEIRMGTTNPEQAEPCGLCGYPVCICGS